MPGTVTFYPPLNSIQGYYLLPNRGKLEPCYSIRSKHQPTRSTSSGLTKNRKKKNLRCFAETRTRLYILLGDVGLILLVDVGSFMNWPGVVWNVEVRRAFFAGDNFLFSAEHFEGPGSAFPARVESNLRKMWPFSKVTVGSEESSMIASLTGLLFWQVFFLQILHPEIDFVWAECRRWNSGSGAERFPAFIDAKEKTISQSEEEFLSAIAHPTSAPSLSSQSLTHCSDKIDSPWSKQDHGRFNFYVRIPEDNKICSELNWRCSKRCY